MHSSLAIVAAEKVISASEALADIKAYDRGEILEGISFHRGSRWLPTRARKAIDSKAGAAALQLATLVGSALALSSRRSRKCQVVGAGVLALTSVIESYRCPYGNDGADQMSAVICGYRAVTGLIPDHSLSDDIYLRAVNAQTFLAYLTPGLAKLISSSWLSGTALQRVLETSQYGSSAIAVQLRRYPGLSKALTWITIVWETAFPLVYLLPARLVNPALGAVKLFHAGVALTMDLPRFFWSFSAAHSAVLYITDSRVSRPAIGGGLLS